MGLEHLNVIFRYKQSRFYELVISLLLRPHGIYSNQSQGIEYYRFLALRRNVQA